MVKPLRSGFSVVIKSSMRGVLVRWMHRHTRSLSDLLRGRNIGLHKAHEAVYFTSEFVGPCLQALKNMSLPAECPHPLCSSILHEVDGARQHLDEHHSLTPSRRSRPKRSSESSEAENASSKALPKKRACLASPDSDRPEVKELQWEAVMTLPQAQEEFGSKAEPSTNRFYSSGLRIIDSGPQSPIQFPWPPPKQSGELSWSAEERLDVLDDDCDSVESFDSLPSLSSLFAASSSQTTDLQLKVIANLASQRTVLRTHGMITSMSGEGNLIHGVQSWRPFPRTAARLTCTSSLWNLSTGSLSGVSLVQQAQSAKLSY